MKLKHSLVHNLDVRGNARMDHPEFPYRSLSIPMTVSIFPSGEIRALPDYDLNWCTESSVNLKASDRACISDRLQGSGFIESLRRIKPNPR